MNIHPERNKTIFGPHCSTIRKQVTEHIGIKNQTNPDKTG